jgi:hypothetical protein
MIAGIDWSPADLTSREIDAFTEDLFTRHGVILAGSRYTVTEQGRTAKGRTATAAFHRLMPPCFIGEGCANPQGSTGE